MTGQTNQRLWDMVQDLDEHYRDNTVTDWELSFIGDLHGYIAEKRSYTAKQAEHVLRLWEKYCA